MKDYTCICGGKMKETTLEFDGFEVRGWKCPKCNEELLDPLAVDAIREIKNKSTVKLREIGKSTVVTIPSALRHAARLKYGEKIQWRVERGELVLGHQLLKKINPVPA